MKISDILPQKKKDRYNIYVDGLFRFGLSGFVVAKYNLYKGKDVTAEVLDEVLESEIYFKLYDKSIGKLARRPHSAREVAQYLREVLYKKSEDWFKGIAEERKKLLSKEIPEKVIADLQEKNLLNDEDFAKWWIESRDNFRPRGWIAVKQELLQKGVDGKLVDKFAPKVENQLVLAEKAYLKAFPNRKPEFQKAAMRLKSKGFDWDTIKKVLKNHNITYDGNEVD